MLPLIFTTTTKLFSFQLCKQLKTVCQLNRYCAHKQYHRTINHTKMLPAVILFKTSFESTELFIHSFNHEVKHSPRQNHFPKGKKWWLFIPLGNKFWNVSAQIVTIFLPINYNWVWWSLIFVSTWLLLTASTSKRKTKDLTLAFNTMLQTFNTSNKKIPEQYQSFKHSLALYIRTNILLLKYLHITSCVMSTRHISGFLSWPSYTMGWSEKNCSVIVQQ